MKRMINGIMMSWIDYHLPLPLLQQLEQLVHSQMRRAQLNIILDQDFQGEEFQSLMSVKKQLPGPKQLSPKLQPIDSQNSCLASKAMLNVWPPHITIQGGWLSFRSPNSPNSMQKNFTTRRFMQLNLNNDYEPSSCELSTPNRASKRTQTQQVVKSSGV